MNALEFLLSALAAGSIVGLVSRALRLVVERG